MSIPARCRLVYFSPTKKSDDNLLVHIIIQRHLLSKSLQICTVPTPKILLSFWPFWWTNRTEVEKHLAESTAVSTSFASYTGGQRLPPPLPKVLRKIDLEAPCTTCQTPQGVAPTLDTCRLNDLLDRKSRLAVSWTRQEEPQGSSNPKMAELAEFHTSITG